MSMRFPDYLPLAPLGNHATNPFQPTLVVSMLVWNLAMTSTKEKTPIILKESFLWWRHEFYQTRWKGWHSKWVELAAKIPAEHEDAPVSALRKLTEKGCDPDVALRLAFLEVNHKPAAQSELAKENARQQRMKRRLDQSRKRLLKTAVELEQALSDVSLIFIKRENVNSLRSLAEMCSHEIETLLWPHALELPPGHELFTLAAYVNVCCGKPNYALVADLLGVVYSAAGRMPPTKDAIEKQLQRFRNLDSIFPEVINQDVLLKAKSGELKKDLLTYYPG